MLSQSEWKDTAFFPLSQLFAGLRGIRPLSVELAPDTKLCLVRYEWPLPDGVVLPYRVRVSGQDDSIHSCSLTLCPDAMVTSQPGPMAGRHTRRPRVCAAHVAPAIVLSHLSPGRKQAAHCSGMCWAGQLGFPPRRCCHDCLPCQLEPAAHVKGGNMTITAPRVMRNPLYRSGLVVMPPSDALVGLQ